MGCDIHCYAEVKKNGVWQKVGKIFKNPYYREGEPNKISDDGFEWNPQYIDSPYDGRNYDTFAILADVRNGYGFRPIAYPKGLPEDVSLEIQELSDEWNGDGHSHSWLTLKELLDYDWNGQHTKHRGMVHKNEAEEYKKTGKLPDCICGWTNQENFVNFEWEESYYESAQYFVDNVIPELQKLGEPENVRIVFWFDN